MTPPPPHQRRGGPPPARPHHEWLVNEERERSVTDIADRLIMIGQRLKETGAVNLDNVEVRPDDPSRFVIRFERLPRGELKLHLEIEWSPIWGAGPVGTDDLAIT